MDAETETGTNAPPAPPMRRGSRLVRVATMTLWGVVVVIALWSAIQSPGAGTIGVAVCFTLLFAAVNAQWLLRKWTHHRALRGISRRMMGTGYVSDLYGLPNRNYLLAELRREMAVARGRGTPFALLQISFDGLNEVEQRRGADFCDRAIGALVKLLRRITRDSDFIAFLGEARFVVVLNECTGEQAHSYLRRIPGSIAVSDGKRMYEVPVAARLLEYDMESLYATDVLAALQDSPALHRREHNHVRSVAA